MIQKEYVHASFCTGIGACELAAMWMGWRNAFSCEIDPFCHQVLKYYYPHIKHYENIFGTDFSEWRGKIDILTAGFPCQPFSCAGSRKGAEDDRYLWPEVLRGVDEIRPNWFIGENVAGITSMVLPGDEIKVESYTDLEGESYLETEMRQQFIVDRICNDLESIGYSVQPIIIPACAVGAPHRRDRIWFIANCSNARPEGMQQGENGIYEFEVTADTTSTRFQERFILDRREDEKETGTRVDDELKQYGKERIVTNTDKELLEGRDAQRPQRRENQEFTIKSFNCSSCWENFPSQSPVCCGDDGLPSQLSGITFSKHRAESIKAYGNSMVPQLVYQIFKAIGEVENLLKLNQNKKNMKCIRCNNLFDSSIPEINAECYGGYKTYACPLCGKLYVFTRIVKVDAVPDENICELEDNWGSPIVKDSEYKK